MRGERWIASVMSSLSVAKDLLDRFGEIVRSPCSLRMTTVLTFLLTSHFSPLTAQTAGTRRRRSTLVHRAVDRRLAVQADSALTSYRARAHGFVFFLAQVGEGLTEPPRLVKADELDVEVYWRAPDRSKQVILGWRDGTFLPTDINYHRDHLGIVTNNFGNLIRIGEGDEVRDAVHPLSPEGLDGVRLRALPIRWPSAPPTARSRSTRCRFGPAPSTVPWWWAFCTSTSRRPSWSGFASASLPRRISIASWRTSASFWRARSTRTATGCRAARRSRSAGG